MDEITRVIKEMFWLLQNVNIAEEDYKVGTAPETDEMKEELCSCFISHGPRTGSPKGIGWML